MKTVASLAFTVLALGSAIVITTGCGGGNSAAILPPNISVSLSSGASSVMATGTAVFTAVVTGDTAGKGVTWTVTCSAAQCGSVSAGPPSGTPGSYNGTYTAPPTPPASDLTVTIKAVSVADGSKSGSANLTVSAITLSPNLSGTGVTASTATTATLQVGAGNALLINITVNNDPSNQGVKFTISPTSQGSSLAVPDAFDATYNAPSTAPASDLIVTITATSVEDSSKTLTLTITVPSVTISINPATATVDAQGSVSVTATVGNDGSGKGVTWAVQPCGATDCGSIPGTPTLSGSAAKYTAPATPPDPGDLTVTLTANSVADPPAQASMTITVKAISIVVTPANANVLFATTLSNIVATVNDDPAKKGVSWAIQPCGVTDCGSISTNASASGQAITYTAPANPPANDLSVTIVATSISDTTQSGAITINIPAITVLLSPTSAIIPVGATAALNGTPFAPTVNNDSSAQVNVNWTLMQNGAACTAAVCGTVTPPTTASGTAVIYAAPSTVPANPSVTITATSATDNTKSASASITLTNGTVKLIPSALNYGNLKIIAGRPRPTETLSATLTNTGASALNITGESVTGTNTNAFSVNTGQTTCSTSAASGASCVLAVTFTPPGVGSFSADLSIADGDITSPQQIALSGQAHSCFYRCPPGADLRSALAQHQVTAAPIPTGTSRVGTRVIDLVDANRSDPYLANGAKRELQVRFWYPAAAGGRCTPAEYTSAAVWNYLAQLEKIAAPQVKTNSCQNAPVTSGAHPVVVFTHGYTGTFTDYTFLFEELASRGYIVASVNHTFEATAIEFRDGRVVKSLVGTHLGPSLQLDAKSTSFAVAVRLADLEFVMDQLAAMSTSRTGPFTGRLDMSRVALAGHSLGGMTALLGLKMEPRFQAAISIDGVMPGPLFGSTRKPVLILFAGRDWDQDTCHLWSGLHGARLALNFKGSEHLTPSDAVWLAPGAIKTGTVGIEGTVAAIRNYIAEFLDANLIGAAPGQLIRGRSTDYPDVEVTTQTQSLCGSAHKSELP
jgi:dienelactone hydrolase